MLALSAFSQRLEEHSKCVAAERGPDPCQDPEPIAATAGETAAETMMPSSTGSTAESAETPKPVETQIKDLCQEWQGTIRSLWSRQIQLFESPPGSWKMTYDLLKTSVAFKSARSTLTGDSRRAEEPKHMLAVMNINRAPVDFTAVELAKLLESLKDSEGSLLPGVILAIFEAQKDSVRQVLAKQTKGMAMRTLTIGYRQSDVERCAERIKSSSFLNMMENLVLITSTTLKLPTKRRMHFGDSNKGNLLTDVPLLCLGYASIILGFLLLDWDTVKGLHVFLFRPSSALGSPKFILALSSPGTVARMGGRRLVQNLLRRGVETVASVQAESGLFFLLRRPLNHPSY